MKNVKLVGEIGINHNGDIELAKKLVSVANISGINYVKFQKRDIDSCYTQEFLDGPRESPYGVTQREQKEGIELTTEDYISIDTQCRIIKMGWFASPWDTKSVDFLSQFDVPYMKVASACITDFEILEVIKQTGIPVIISTGMSTKAEVDKCLNYLGGNKLVEYILACKSTYPTLDEDMNMNFITTLKKEYPKYKIGFSNHNSGIQFCLGAIFLGVEMIEFHMTLDRSMYGSDQAASIEINGIFKLGEHIRSIEKGLGSGSWIITSDEEKIREKLRK
jgi:N-acetylneuraminate synthase